MSSKVLLFTESTKNLDKIDSSYQGVYFKVKDIGDIHLIKSLSKDYDLFFDTLDLDLNECFSLASSVLGLNATFVCGDIQKAIFIKSVSNDFKISYFTEIYNENLILLLKANGWDITIKYTALAPERIEKFKREGILVNGYVLTRLDEVGVLKFWNTDYITFKQQPIAKTKNI